MWTRSWGQVRRSRPLALSGFTVSASKPMSGTTAWRLRPFRSWRRTNYPPFEITFVVVRPHLLRARPLLQGDGIRVILRIATARPPRVAGDQTSIASATKETTGTPRPDNCVDSPLGYRLLPTPLLQHPQPASRVASRSSRSELSVPQKGNDTPVL